MLQVLRKALFMSAFLLSFSNGFTSENCPPPTNTKPEQATVKWVYDGDTVLLTDKRKIRIIGVDTPEKKQRKKPAEPYSGQAREALRELLKKHAYKVMLYYGDERKDRYRRTLAHVYLADGTNVSSWLLQKGLATTLSYPPNTKLADCYKEIEKHAQKQKLKLWSLKSHQQKEVTNLSGSYKGYIRLKAKVKKIHWYKKSIAIELQTNSRRPILVTVKRKYIRYFESLRFNKLINQHIIVSGMLKNKRGNRVIALSHPSQLEILSVNNLERKSIIKWSSQE